MRRLKRRCLFLFFALLSVAGVGFALWQGTTTIPSVGSVKTYGVSVWQSDMTTPLTEIDWGMVDPNQSYVRTIYVKNEGSVDMQLSMATTNWSPGNASTCINLTWNRKDFVLNGTATTPADLTLTIGGNVGGITAFAFDIVIAATEASLSSATASTNQTVVDPAHFG